MLSILIPTYNFDIRGLVRDLYEQCNSENIIHEILCYDDGSRKEMQQSNHAIVEMATVIYKILPENLGRSKIRNLMAKEAHYDHVLFLDCDSGIIQQDFIKSYLSNLEERVIVCGGRRYAEAPPQDLSLIHI